MSLNGKHEIVAIKDICLDVENPRIKRFLEIYGDNPTPQQIALALGAGIDDPEGQSVPTFSKLKQSILTNGGVIQQIASIVGGKGGGKPDNARGGGKDAGRLDEAIAKAKTLIG